jgi:hypothetical protein
MLTGLVNTLAADISQTQVSKRSVAQSNNINGTLLAGEVATIVEVRHCVRFFFFPF